MTHTEARRIERDVMAKLPTRLVPLLALALVLLAVAGCAEFRTNNDSRAFFDRAGRIKD